MKLEKLIKTNEIVNTIDEWIKTLHCRDLNCPFNAEMLFPDVSEDEIYCNFHASWSGYSSKSINLKEKLNMTKLMMNALEKKLLLTQKLMALIRSNIENVDPDSKIGKYK